MSTITGGTTTTSNLTGIVVPSKSSGATTHFLPADIATINNLIKDDLNNLHPIVKGAFRNEILIIPNRGPLLVLPGDYVFVDANGWPILVSAHSIATGGWTHT
jgi:hypothetical protein